MSNYKRTLGALDPIGIKGCFVAGGAVLSRVTKTNINDYDIYPKSNDDCIETCCALLENDCFVINISDRAVTFKSNAIVDDKGQRTILQVMRFKEFPNASDVFETFDFTVCMGAYDCDTEEYHFADDFWPDVASKTLRFNPATEYPLNSLIRIGKYSQKGYICGKGEFAKIALTVARKGMPAGWEELENQIGGVYGKSIKLARESEEFCFDKAIEVLSYLDISSCLQDFSYDFSWVKAEEIEAILSGKPLEVYLFNSKWYIIGRDGDVLDYDCNAKIREYVEVLETPLVSIPAVKTWKALKKTDVQDVYVGAVYGGSHNGVTYSPSSSTTYEQKPYLFSYRSKGYAERHKEYMAETRIYTEDIIEIQSDKIVSKSMMILSVSEVDKTRAEEIF